MYDIYYFSLTSTANDLPGLLVTAAPRKADRHRQQDRMAVLLTLSGRHPLDEAGQKSLVMKLVESYYATNKTITAGIRTAVETLNATLFDRNRNGAHEGWNAAGLLNLAVQHEDRVYVVNIGPTHTFFLGHHDVMDWNDNGGARGLGLSNQVNPRFYSETLEAGDLLVFCPQPPSSWTPAALQGSPALTFDHLRRRLMNQAGANLQAGVVQFKAGGGDIHPLRLRPVARPVVVDAPISQPLPTTPTQDQPRPSNRSTSQPAIESPAPAVGLPSLNEVFQESAPVVESTAPPMEKPLSPLDLFPEDEEPQPTPPAVVADSPLTPSRPAPPAAVEPLRSTPAGAPPRPIQPPASLEHQLPLPEGERLDEPPRVQDLQRPHGRRTERQRQVARAWLGGQAWRKKVSGALGRLFWRTLPTQGDTRPTIPLGWLWFTAIAVPLLVVAISMTIFTQLGRGKTQQAYLQQARILADQAMNAPDPANQRDLWNQTEAILDKAEEYGENAETNQLRNAIALGMDELDEIKRLPFNETLRSGLAENVKIIRMVANGNEIFALDEASGTVLHFVGAGDQYEVDEKFLCRPQDYNGIIVSRLVDLMPLPNGILSGYDVLAVDETGNLVYCGTDVMPTATTLTPPDQFMGKVAGIAQSGKVLLVLDKGRNMIWRYGDPTESETSSSSLVDWSQKPKPYFQQNLPSLMNVVDFVANGDDLYLVDADGLMTTCSYSAIVYAPTECQQPAQFEDPRPGRTNKVTEFDGTLFTHLNIDPLNRQSLYVLDQNQPSVYRLSLKLFLDKVFQADARSHLPEGQPTAFVVTTNQTMVLAYGNRLFFARP